jgi:hypothetical protein
MPSTRTHSKNALFAITCAWMLVPMAWVGCGQEAVSAGGEAGASDGSADRSADSAVDSGAVDVTDARNEPGDADSGSHVGPADRRDAGDSDAPIEDALADAGEGMMDAVADSAIALGWCTQIGGQAMNGCLPHAYVVVTCDAVHCIVEWSEQDGAVSQPLTCPCIAEADGSTASCTQ